MSEWKGFDPRKICPRCGQYETHMEIPARRGVNTSVRLAGIVFIVCMLIALSVPNATIRIWGTVFIMLLWVGVTLTYARTLSMKRTSELPREYWLTCLSCGHKWHMTSEAWELAGQKELERFKDFPDQFSSSQRTSLASYERIPWEPPSKSRGILIIAITILITLVVFLGGGWWLTHLGDPIIDSIGIALVFLFLFGIQAIFKVKRNRLIPLVLLLLLAGMAIALRFLIK